MIDPVLVVSCLVRSKACSRCCSTIVLLWAWGHEASFYLWSSQNCCLVLLQMAAHPWAFDRLTAQTVCTIGTPAWPQVCWMTFMLPCWTSLRRTVTVICSTTVCTGVRPKRLGRWVGWRGIMGSQPDKTFMPNLQADLVWEPYSIAICKMKWGWMETFSTRSLYTRLPSELLYIRQRHVLQAECRCDCCVVHHRSYGDHPDTPKKASHFVDTGHGDLHLETWHTHRESFL